MLSYYPKALVDNNIKQAFLNKNYNNNQFYYIVIVIFFKFSNNKLVFDLN